MNKEAAIFSYTDLREWLKLVDSIGELKRIVSADCNLEMGTVAELIYHEYCLAEESDLHPRLIRIAVDYAAEHADEIRERIDHNRGMAERSRRMAQQREALLA